MKIISFGTRREDTNHVKILRDGGEMMTFPRIRVTDRAIKNMSKTSSTANINELLATAKNLQYGMMPNSALRAYLQQNSLLSGEVLENNDWAGKLQKAITRAVKKLPKNRRDAFIQSYNEIFVEPKNLTPLEKEIIDYRESIIDSEPFKEAFDDKSMEEKTSKALKFLDYFIASSETPMQEKAYVLQKLAYLVSPEYNINPQLKNKKFQVFSEIINDLVVKTPESPVLTTKACSQEHHGSCAAISMARKTLLYEDKVAYIDILLSELDDKPYLEIYDITNLQKYSDEPEKLKKYRAPKIQVDKTFINYDRATYEGYRIIDASVLNWMKIALSSGDGTISFQDYFAFDNRHRGLMHDSRLIISEDKDYKELHALLRVLIKGKERIKSYEKALRNQAVKDKEISRNGLVLRRKVDIEKGKIKEILTSISNKPSAFELDNIIKGLCSNININIRNNKKVLKDQIVTYLTSKLGAEYELQIQKNAQKILPVLKNYVNSIKELNSVEKGVAEKYNLNKKLFDIAVAQREHLKRRVKLPDAADDYFNELHMPDYATQIKYRLRSLIKLADAKPNSPVLVKLKEINGLNNDKELKQMLLKMEADITTNLPQAIDKELENYGVSYKGIMVRTFEVALNNHRRGNYDYMYEISNRTNIIPDVKNFEKQLIKVLDKLRATDCENYDEINKIVSTFGVHNQFTIVVNSVNNLAKIVDSMLKNGEHERVNEMLNQKIKTDDLGELIHRFNEINQNIAELSSVIYDIAEMIDFPSKEEIVMKAYENKGKVLSEAELDDLKVKIDELTTLRRYSAVQREQGDDMRLPHKVFVDFSDSQKRSLEKIRKALPEFKREVQRDYKTVNKLLKPMLDELYATVGKRNGHFWIGEEGSSGLMDSESIRIIEQMTGRPYHIEKDIDEAIRQIKEGRGSGSSSTMVCYDEYSGHAQYVADIAPVRVKNLQTGKFEYKDAFLHDNTWGRGEKIGLWVDDKGVRHTDYGKNYGGSDGFVVTDGLLAGKFVDNLKYDFGVDTTPFNELKPVSGPEAELIDEISPYPIFSGSVRLPGIDPRATQGLEKLQTMISQIVSANAVVNSLVALAKNENININSDMIEKGDELINNRVDEVIEQIGKYDKIKLKAEDFDKLPKNSPVKLLVKKHIIRKAFPLLADDMRLSSIKTESGLERYKTSILNSIKDGIRDLTMVKITPEFINSCVSETNIAIRKEFSDEDIKMFTSGSLLSDILAVYKNLDKNAHNGIGKQFAINVAYAVSDVLYENKALNKLEPAKREDICKRILDVVNNTMSELIIPMEINDIMAHPDGAALIKFVENKFNPVNDAGVMLKIVDLINMPTEKVEALLKDATFEDFGKTLDTPQNVIKLIQAGNSLERKRFREEVRLHYFNQYIKTSAIKGEVSVEQAQFNRLLRSVIIILANMGVEKYINQAREEAFTKYGARPAIPDIKIKSQEELHELLNSEVDNLINGFKQILSFNMTMELADSLKNLRTFVDTAGKKDMKQIKDELINHLDVIIQKTTGDPSTANMRNTAKKLRGQLKNGDVYYIDAQKKVESMIKEFEKTFGDIQLRIPLHVASLKEAIKNDIEGMIQVNILPSHQSRIRRKLNDLMRILAKNTPELESQYKKVRNDLIEDMSKHHMFTNTTVLLNTCLQKAKQKTTEGKEDLDKYILDNLMSELVESIKKATLAEFQYKLMNMASKGYVTKVKDVLDKSGLIIPLSNGETVKFYSPEGLWGFRNTIKDASNNNQTFKLLIEQMGLIDMLAEALMLQDLKKFRKEINSETKILASAYPSLGLIKLYFDDFFKQVEEFPECTKENLLAFTEEYLANIEDLGATQISKDWLKYYSDQFKSIVKACESVERTQLRELFVSIHVQCLEFYQAQIDTVVESLNGIRDFIFNHEEELSEIKLIEGSDVDERRYRYLEELAKLKQYHTDCANYLNTVLSK